MPRVKADAKEESWWKTMPGMLTATAAIITALGGLLLALFQAGLLGGKAAPSAHPAEFCASQARRGY